MRGLAYSRLYWLPALTCVAVIGAFAYLARQLDFALIDLAKFLTVVAVLILPAGWLVVLRIPLPTQPPLTRLGLATLVGYPITVAAYFVLGLMKLTSFYPAFLISASLTCLILVLRDARLERGGLRKYARTILFGIREVDWIAILILLLVLVISFPWLRYLIPNGSGYVFVGYWDSLTHVGLVQEMLRGVPPTEWPMVAGENFPRYHIFYHVFVMLAARYSALDLIKVFYIFVPMLLNGLVVLGLCLALNSLFRSRAAGWLAVGAIYVFGPLLEEFLARLFAIGAPSIRFLYVSPPALGGLAVVVGFFASLMLFHRITLENPQVGGAPRLVHLAGFLAAALYMFKAPFFVLIFQSFLLGLVLFWLREHRTFVFWSAGWALASFSLFHFGWQAPSWSRLIIQFGIFAQTRLLEAQRLLEAKRYLYQLIEYYLLQPGGQWAWLGLLLLTLLIIWRFALLSPLLLAYWYNRARAFRWLGLWEIVLGVMFPVVAANALFLDAAELRLTPRGLLVTVMLVLLSLTSLVLNASLIGWFVNRLLRSRWPQLPLGALLMILIIAAAPAAAWVIKHRGNDRGISLPSAELTAYAFLAQNTPREAVVAQNKYTDFAAGSYAVVSAFSGRRVVFERQPVLFRERMLDIERLYNTTNWAEALSVVRRYRVDYIIEYEERPLHVEKQVLSLVFDAGDVRVYAVPPALKDDFHSIVSAPEQ